MKLGGKVLDPKNPADAQVIARVQASQQPAAATTTAATTCIEQCHC
jgi:hypothetical protein